MRLLALLLAATLLLTACGDDADTPPDEPGLDQPGDGGDAAGTQPHDDELASITGTFGADAELEGGCAWVETDGQRYEVQWPEGYTVDFAADPVTLRGPDGAAVAEVGDSVTVEGSVSPDVMTVCQIGPAFTGTAVSAGGDELP